MTKKARLWVGTTMLAVIIFNYTLIGVPLLYKSFSIQHKYKATITEQMKSKNFFKNTDYEYMLEVYRKEKVSIDRKMLILNCASLTFLIITASWVVYGMVFAKNER